VRDALGRWSTAYLFLIALAIGIALLVMGNTLARLIGIGFLAVCLWFVLRVVGKRSIETPNSRGD